MTREKIVEPKRHWLTRSYDDTMTRRHEDTKTRTHKDTKIQRHEHMDTRNKQQEARERVLYGMIWLGLIFNWLERDKERECECMTQPNYS